MTWYKTGLVEATSNSTIITGTGTSFITNARIGDGIVIESGDGNIPPSIYEITNIASETQISIYPEYTGLGGEGLKYAVVHIMGYDKDLSDAFNRLRIEIGGYLANLQELDDWVLTPTQEAKDAAIAASASALSASNSATEAEQQADRAEASADGVELYAQASEQSAQQSANSAAASLQYSQDAAQSSSNALSSENNAKDSENAALQSEQNASVSESNANNSALASASSASNALASEQSAGTSATNASTSASEASDSANSAEVAKGLAQKWATSDELVDGLDYSAKKYAQDSSNSSQSAFTSADNAAQSAVNAATSLSNIQDSEVNAATSASEAESWSEVAKDWAVSSDEVEGGLYSAKKYAEEAHSYTEGLADDIQDIYTQLQGKVDSSALSSNLTYFMTTAASNVAGYNRLVTDTHDSDFNTTEVVYESGVINGDNIPIGAFITDNGTKAQHHDNLTLTIIGAVRRASPDSANCAVKFEVWVRQSNNTEYKIGESGRSSNIGATFHDISMSAIIPHVQFEVGDRLVIKYFADKLGSGSNPKIRYRIGGDDPMRGLLPLPITAMLPELSAVAVSGSYNDLSNKPTLFDGNYNSLSNKPTLNAMAAESDAPSDDKQYARKNGGWAEVVGGSASTNTYQGWYGTVWDSVSDTYFRTGAAGYTSIQSQMKRCVLNTDGTVNYFLHPDNSNFKEDGSASVLNGTDGNVMVQIPKFYAQYLDDGRLKGIKISLSPEDGFPIHPAFVKNGVEVDYRYYRGYECIVQSGILKSISGVTPTRSFTFPVGRGYAKANGSGWGMTDYNLLFAVQTLMIVECNSMLSDQFFGTGNHTGNDYGITTGQSNHIGNGSSPSTNNDMWMSYRGIENFYADCWEMIDGINFSDYVPYINNNLDSFASDVFSGDYISTGITLPVGSGVYVSDYHFSPKGIFAKTVSGGSQVRAAGDGFWSNTGSRVLYHGGHANLGFLGGAFCFHSLNAASDSNVTVGAGISF